jgi:hypothetical protein
MARHALVYPPGRADAAVMNETRVPSPLCPEDKVLLACARIELESPARRQLEQLLETELDWQQVVTKAVRQGIPTLVYHHLRCLDGAALVSPQAWATLETVYRAARLVAMRQRFECQRLLDALHGASIPVILLKGLALSETIYPDPALRLSGDMDILVPQAAVEQAERILQDLRYVVAEKNPPPDLYRPGYFHHLAPYYQPEHEVQVDVHWDLAPPKFAFLVDVEGLWRRATTSQIAERTVQMLAPEDLLLHLVLHLSAMEFFQTGMRHLVDLAEVVRHFEAQFDWEEVVARAASWQAGRYAYLVLRVMQELLDVSLPETALQRLRPEGFEEQMVASALARVLAAVRPGDREPVSSHLALFLLGGWRGGRLRMLWNNVFPSRTRLAALYDLQPGSLRMYCYYLLRPFLLLGRYVPVLVSAFLGSKRSAKALESKKRDMLLDQWLESGS